MNISPNERNAARREAFAGLSLVIVLLLVTSLGGIFLFRELPAYVGYDMQRRLAGLDYFVFAVVAIFALGALVYLSVICWLIFAKLFLSREEVLKIARYGRMSRFDGWLVNLFFPENGSDTRG